MEYGLRKEKVDEKTAVLPVFFCCAGLCSGGAAFAARTPDCASPDTWMPLPENAEKDIDVFCLYPSA